MTFIEDESITDKEELGSFDFGNIKSFKYRMKDGESYQFLDDNDADEKPKDGELHKTQQNILNLLQEDETHLDQILEDVIL